MDTRRRKDFKDLKVGDRVEYADKYFKDAFIRLIPGGIITSIDECVWNNSDVTCKACVGKVNGYCWHMGSVYGLRLAGEPNAWMGGDRKTIRIEGI